MGRKEQGQLSAVMEEYFAIKRPDAWLWAGKLTREQVLARLEDGRITVDWLICPLGCADYAVTAGQFVDDPTGFQRRKQREADRENVKRSIVASVEKPFLLKIGQCLLKWFLLCLLVGGAIVRFFLPEMRGGLTPTALMILIPIWSIGGVGLVALVLGWIQHRHRGGVSIKRHSETGAQT